MITLENKKLYDLIVSKDALVDVGRKISQELEGLEVKIKDFEEKEKKITAEVIPSPSLKEEGDKIAKSIEGSLATLEKIGRQIEEEKLAAIPPEMKRDHQDLIKQREVLERERNKVALKVQKIKDKAVPLIRKEVKPLLGEYDDIETAKTKGGKVVIVTFNHLEDFKSKFKK